MRPRPTSDRGLEQGASPFVRSFVHSSLGAPPQLVLDVPCGFGRHAFWLAELGHRVTGIDVSPERIERAGKDAEAFGLAAKFIVGDANRPLLVPADAFDMALIVHFVSEQLLRNVTPALKTGGYLVYETFGGQGRNWTDLPALGAVEDALLKSFDVIHYQERRVGPNKDRAVVSAVARKR